jgi:predicted N-formylglutamate amidohydrolase
METGPVEIVNAGGDARLLLLCDHASNRVPPCLGTLGLPPEDMERHIAYDVGARGVTLALARLLDAPAVLATWSRLVIDPNRGEDDPTLVMELYDGSVIPANRGVAAAEIARRLDRFHRPYHAAVAARIARARAAGHEPVLVGIHSMTRQLRGRPPRPWAVAVLYGPDDRLARPLLARLRQEPGLCVGDNEPYRGALAGDTMDRHGVGNGLAHVLIEVRNDLISDPGGEAAWAARLAPALRDAIAAFRGER